ncbi:hypothetical protein I1A62_37360 [Rhodococcus sp. USK10]|uniref:hypothetical protein n=1 Tax=Rhodococcus sp. USK10 TaxID=2789739 RepID=UPI001C5EE784|nr:hypothetical protein [Rhodococcus sp. USK10]QYB02796.1 hypothetical protein I1A62_37360 [Rhodococcus sp. USK10]
MSTIASTTLAEVASEWCTEAEIQVQASPASGGRNATRSVLFIGNPSTVTEVTHWAAVRHWTVEQGLKPVREFRGDVVCAIVTEAVAEGTCPSADAAAVQRVRARGLDCIPVYDIEPWGTARLSCVRPPTSGP